MSPNCIKYSRNSGLLICFLYLIYNAVGNSVCANCVIYRTLIFAVYYQLSHIIVVCSVKIL